jgi:hypothetical protein
MTFNVIINDYKYTINFMVDDNVTFCNIKDSDLQFVISAGHSLCSPDDDFNPVEGMKKALRRALDASPCLFNREVKGLCWEGFWECVDLVSDYKEDVGEEIYGAIEFNTHEGED